MTIKKILLFRIRSDKKNEILNYFKNDQKKKSLEEKAIFTVLYFYSNEIKT